MILDWIHALLGGALIGLAASLLLLFNGRVMGVSGILNSAFSRREGPNAWRWSALAGLLVGGLILQATRPESFSPPLGSMGAIALAGALVGLGSAMGGGCTSGHGVCGISRLSVKSLVATCVFILAGALTVIALRIVGVRP